MAPDSSGALASSTSRRNVSTASRTEPGQSPDEPRTDASRASSSALAHTARRSDSGYDGGRLCVTHALYRWSAAAAASVAPSRAARSLPPSPSIFPASSWSSRLSANDAARGAARSMGAPPVSAVVVVLFRSSDSVFTAGASRSSARPCLSDHDLASAAWSDRFRIAASRLESETPDAENSSASEACAACAAASRASNLAASASSAASAAAMTAAPSSAARLRSSARISSTSTASSKNTKG
mmetsp:Transcript_10229/g.42217  ORF Transcript_10229/g.42217 Transcript_10229/m.42217 type:complete len:241 (+) Transcript_10229:5459-6181(+)